MSLKELFKNFICMVMVITLISGSMLGCAKEKSKEEGIRIYHLSEDRANIVYSNYKVKSINPVEQVDEVMEVLRGDFDNGESALFEMVRVNDVAYEDGILTLNFNQAYDKISDRVDETLMRACIVLTISQFENVDGIIFKVDGKNLKNHHGVNIGVMTANDFMDKVGNTVNNYESKTLTLYFANYQGNALKTEIKTAMIDINESIEMQIIKMLIDGPSEKNLYKTIPSNALVRSVHVSNGICYVDFSDEILTSVALVKDNIMIYSIVNSLTELSYINKVQFSVEGSVSEKLHNNYSLENAFSRDLSYMEE